jgi:hypothetical protein
MTGLANSPFAAFLSIVPLFDRADTGAAIEHLIDKLDQQDGDPDLEEHGLEDGFTPHAADGPGCPVADCGELDGDEQDGSFAEDEPCASHARHGSGPGCIISDPDRGVDDDGEIENGF